MLNQQQYKLAKDRQREIMAILNRFAQNLSGENNIEKIYQMTFNFQDLGYVFQQLKEVHDFWFTEANMPKRNRVLLGDCLEIMPKIPDGYFDMILCDLPYGTTARNKWDEIIPFAPIWKQYERIIKDNGAIVLTAAEPFTSMLITSNPKLFRYDLIWEKATATGFLNANRMPLRAHEQILVFYKKLPTYNPQKTQGSPYKMTRRDIGSNYNDAEVIQHTTNNEDGLRYPRSVLYFPHDKDKLHPTQKPVALFEYLIKTYTNEGEIVLDNCAGSGTTGEACENLGRKYVLIEKEQKYYDIILNRLKLSQQSQP